VDRSAWPYRPGEKKTKNAPKNRPLDRQTAGSGATIAGSSFVHRSPEICWASRCGAPGSSPSGHNININSGAVGLQTGRSTTVWKASGRGQYVPVLFSRNDSGPESSSARKRCLRDPSKKGERACAGADLDKRWESSLGLNPLPLAWLQPTMNRLQRHQCSTNRLPDHGDYFGTPPRSSKRWPSLLGGLAVWFQQVVALIPSAFRSESRVRAWDRRPGGRCVSSAGPNEKPCSLFFYRPSERLHLAGWAGPAAPPRSAVIRPLGR